MAEELRALKLVTPPAVEPVAVANDLKTHLRIDHTDEDTYLAGLISAARTVFEDLTGRALITQTWRLTLDAWPDDDDIEIPRWPLQSVTSIVYYDTDGNSTTWSSNEYLVDTESEPGRVVLKDSFSWPGASLRSMNPIQITYVSGLGDDADDVSEQIKQAIRLLAAHYYENREPVISTGSVPKEVPFTIESLIWACR